MAHASTLDVYSGAYDPESNVASSSVSYVMFHASDRERHPYDLTKPNRADMSVSPV